MFYAGIILKGMTRGRVRKDAIFPAEKCAHFRIGENIAVENGEGAETPPRFSEANKEKRMEEVTS